MPDIVIEQSTFERLQRHARPLVDTTDMVVNRQPSPGRAGESRRPYVTRKGFTAERNIDPRKLPNLTHTKVLVYWIPNTFSYKLTIYQ